MSDLVLRNEFYCPEKRPQDGMLGELKRMIDEDMTLEQCVELHRENWNFYAREDIPKGFVAPTFAHECMHIDAGIVCRNNSSLQRWLPHLYNGSMIMEGFIVAADRKFEAAAYGMEIGDAGTIGAALKQRVESKLDQYVREANFREAMAWRLADRSVAPVRIFDLRRRFHFSDSAIREKLIELNIARKIPAPGAINRHGEAYVLAMAPSAAEVDALCTGMAPGLMYLCQIIADEIRKGGNILTRDLHLDYDKTAALLGPVKISQLFPAPHRLSPALQPKAA